MATWDEIGTELQEVGAAGSPYDVVRRKYVRKLSEITGRNTIIYYSGWLQKTQLVSRFPVEFSLNDNDKNGFMATIHGLDRSRGLDLVLHTPGGGIPETESLVGYLRAMFGNDIRVIVPQIALSAGTMLACASRYIIMGKQSSLGPIDPQINGIPAHGVIEEFNRAVKEISLNPATIPVWQTIIGHYHPSFIGECEKAIAWSDEMVKEWLVTGMYAELGQAEAQQRAETVVNELGNHALTKSHARHISVDRAKHIGLTVIEMESDQQLQDAVLSVHHSTIHTLAGTAAIKIIENDSGKSFVQQIQAVASLQAP